MRSFEDLSPGERFDLGEISFTEAQMIAFAARYDPQPFHLDAAAAAASPLKGLASSGWQTCAALSKLFVTGLGGEGRKAVRLMGGAGVEECLWLKPFFPSERAGPLRASAEIRALTPSQSLPDRGFATIEVEGRQAAPGATGPAGPERVICRMRFNSMIARRAPDHIVALRQERPRAPTAAERAAAPKAAPPEVGLTYVAADEIQAGLRIDLGAATFSAESIIAFAEEYDPQPFHLSEAGGAAGPFGALAASGWHSMAEYMGLYVRARLRALETLPEARRRAALANSGPSPGFRNLAWRRPVYAGETIRYFFTLEPVEPWRGRSDLALLKGVLEGETMAGAQVLRFDAAGLIRV